VGDHFSLFTFRFLLLTFHFSLPLMDLNAYLPFQPSKADLLYREIADLFEMEDVTQDWPEPGFIRFRGYFTCDLNDCFDELRRRFERHGYTPMIRQEDGPKVLLAMPTVFDPPPSNWWINLFLLVATILATLFAGALPEAAANAPAGMDETEIYLLALRQLWLGLPFSLSIMLILGAHELGHYFAARYHKVPVTLPYFIPMPLSIIGTMGAFIRIKAPISSRRALLDIGAAGPLAGLIFAVPLLIYGLWISEVQPLPTDQMFLLEGNSLLYAGLKILVFGEMLPNAAGLDVVLSQVAWAGWVGLLVTGLNLIPVGQLDGGHVSYVLFGRRARAFFWPVIMSLFVLALVTQMTMWLIWVALLFFLGRRHAEPLDSVTPLDGRRRLIAIITLLIFFLVFVPLPFQIVTP
jgi:membrane-associated protease RseP (regulator of RpoE activity)